MFKRLIKINRHDTRNRDSAILYINGEIIEGNTHSDAVNKYLNIDNKSVYRYNKITKELAEKNNALGFAHKVNSQYAIFLERWTLKNVDINTVVYALKQKYPNYRIFEEEDDDIDDINNNLNNYHEFGENIEQKNNNIFKDFNLNFDKNEETNFDEDEEFDFSDNAVDMQGRNING